MSKRLSLVLAPFALAALSLTPAAAMDPRLPPLAAEESAEVKLKRFAQTATPALAAEIEKAKEQPARDQIHTALRALPGYAEAVVGFEQSGDNAKAWRALLDTPLADSRFVRAHATYFLGRALLAQDDLAGAAEALEQVRGRLRSGTPWTDEATLYLGYVYARLPELGGKFAAANRSRARLTLSSLVDGEQGPALYGRIPERVREGAVWVLRELSGEGMGPLLELAKRMMTVERMLGRTRTGEGTQVRQQQVVTEIERLIALMREKEQP
jgi:hypothetical protein